jgi:integrase
MSSYEKMVLAVAALEAASPSGIVSNSLSRLAETAAKYMTEGRVESTKKAYASDVRCYTGWCHEHGVGDPFPASGAVVALYIADLAERGYKTSTISRRLSTIAQGHAAGGYPNPCGDAIVRATWKGILKRLGGKASRATPLRLSDIVSMVASLGADQKAVRDRAIILVGFSTSLRRSELVGLDIEDVSWQGDHAIALIRRSKTDQEGKGQKVVIPSGRHPVTCPLSALRAWLDIAGISSGAIFRGVDRHGNISADRLSDRGVDRAVKAAAALAGVRGVKVSGHSLRRGHVTEADARGASKTAIKKQTRHSQDKMIDLYTEDNDLARNNSAFKLGL